MYSVCPAMRDTIASTFLRFSVLTEGVRTLVKSSFINWQPAWVSKFCNNSFVKKIVNNSLQTKLRRTKRHCVHMVGLRRAIWAAQIAPWNKQVSGRIEKQLLVFTLPTAGPDHQISFLFLWTNCLLQRRLAALLRGLYTFFFPIYCR